MMLVNQTVADATVNEKVADMTTNNLANCAVGIGAATTATPRPFHQTFVVQAVVPVRYRLQNTQNIAQNHAPK